VIDPAAADAFEALLARRGGDLLLLVDEDLRIVRAGPEAAILADRREGELAGMSLIAAFGSAPLDSLARQAVSTGEPLRGAADLGHLGERQFAVDAVPLARGGLALSLHDVTTLRRMERVRRDFVANISHELRTPLTSIKLLAETLSSGGADDPATMHDFATQIGREADHLAQLVDELLDLSMIESGETKLALEPIDPEEVVVSCVDRIRPVAERRDVRVRHLDPPATDALVVGDLERLGQALLNLAHNAVKFSHRGGEVRIGWAAANGRVRFNVADDGIGVPEAHRARVFERFYKVDRSRRRDRDERQLGGSAGLGLAIVRHIAEAHGGTVGVQSEEGVGSTFWIEVPRAGSGQDRG
jgi:two-component system, OmpR family, phosphate regulon sensor histidine kinase PhoR